MLSFFRDARRYRSTSAGIADSGPLAGFVRSPVKEMKEGVGRRAMTVGIMDFRKMEIEEAASQFVTARSSWADVTSFCRNLEFYMIRLVI
jgi:hypothetical protein